MTLLLKDPDASLDYSVDWGTEYLSDDVLATSGWSVEPGEVGGVTVVSAESDLLIAADQLHLGVRTARGFVHADARLRRVVETPGEPRWPLIAVYRRRSRNKGN